ncbi:hypothetical protein EMIT074MI3_10999 [Bacillus licheniformis]
MHIRKHNFKIINILNSRYDDGNRGGRRVAGGPKVMYGKETVNRSL